MNWFNFPFYLLPFFILYLSLFIREPNNVIYLIGLVTFTAMIPIVFLMMKWKFGSNYIGLKEKCCTDKNIEDLPYESGYASCKTCKRIFIKKGKDKK